MEILLSVRWEKKYQIIFVRFLWGITQHTLECFFFFSRSLVVVVLQFSNHTRSRNQKEC